MVQLHLVLLVEEKMQLGEGTGSSPKSAFHELISFSCCNCRLSYIRDLNKMTDFETDWIIKYLILIGGQRIKLHGAKFIYGMIWKWWQQKGNTSYIFITTRQGQKILCLPKETQNISQQIHLASCFSYFTVFLVD